MTVSSDGRGSTERHGFFTDTSVCIGRKACDVACKEWNLVPEDGLNFTVMSFDNTGGLDANSWRHVAFIEQREPLGHQETGLGRREPVDLGMPSFELPGASAPPEERGEFRWLMSSDVCKHCTHAAC